MSRYHFFAILFRFYILSVHFQQHGSYLLQVKGNVLIAELNGAWNLETAIEYKNDFKRSAAELVESTWGAFGVFR